MNGSVGAWSWPVPALRVGNDQADAPKRYGGRGTDGSPDVRRLSPGSSGDAERSLVSVAELYKQIAADMRNYSQLGRFFDTGVRRHRVVTAIEKAVAPGRRQIAALRPGSARQPLARHLTEDRDTRDRALFPKASPTCSGDRASAVRHIWRRQRFAQQLACRPGGDEFRRTRESYRESDAHFPFRRGMNHDFTPHPSR